MENILYLIGNGFDCHHKLNTKYNHFKSFVKERNPKLVDEIDELLYEVINDISTNDEDIKEWSRLEEYLGQVHDLYYEDLYDYCLSNSEDDDERSSYFEDPLLNAGIVSDKYIIINKLKDYFQGWIDSIDLVIKPEMKDEELSLSSSAFYINFNYTKTLEKLYEIPTEKVFHIHIKDGEYVLGHNRIHELPFSDPYSIKIEKANGLEVPAFDDDYRHRTVRSKLNELYDDIFYKYYKNSENIIDSNRTIFENIIYFKKIIIMGLSLGREDEIYIEYLSEKMQNVEEILFYYHDPEDESRMRNVLLKYFNDIKLVSKPW